MLLVDTLVRLAPFVAAAAATILPIDEFGARSGSVVSSSGYHQLASNPDDDLLEELGFSSYHDEPSSKNGPFREPQTLINNDPNIVEFDGKFNSKSQESDEVPEHIGIDTHIGKRATHDQDGIEFENRIRIPTVTDHDGPEHDDIRTSDLGRDRRTPESFETRKTNEVVATDLWPLADLDKSDSSTHAATSGRPVNRPRRSVPETTVDWRTVTGLQINGTPMPSGQSKSKREEVVESHDGAFDFPRVGTLHKSKAEASQSPEAPEQPHGSRLSSSKREEFVEPQEASFRFSRAGVLRKTNAQAPQGPESPEQPNDGPLGNFKREEIVESQGAAFDFSRVGTLHKSKTEASQSPEAPEQPHDSRLSNFKREEFVEPQEASFGFSRAGVLRKTDAQAPQSSHGTEARDQLNDVHIGLFRRGEPAEAGDSPFENEEDDSAPDGAAEDAFSDEFDDLDFELTPEEMEELKAFMNSTQASMSYMSMPLDHNNQTSNQTIDIRYMVNDTYYEEGGPVILFQPGRADLKSKDLFETPLLQAVKELKGVLVALEHRYYGLSIPWIWEDTEDFYSLKQYYQYLTIDNTIKDVIHFIENFELDGQKMDHNRIPYVFVGRAESGVLSVYLRRHYPDHIFAAYSSSAPLDMSTTFDRYFEVISSKLDSKCESKLRKVADILSTMWSEGNHEALLETIASVAGANSTEFIELDDVADFVTLPFASYYETGPAGMLEDFCAALTSDADADGSLMAQYIESMKKAMQKAAVFASEFSELFHYSWLWQSCHEWGQFLVAKESDLIPQFKNLELQRAQCQRFFDTDFSVEEAQRKLRGTYGDILPLPSRTFFTEGELNPARDLSVFSEAGDPGLRALKARSEATTCDNSNENNAFFGLLIEGGYESQELREHSPKTDYVMKTFIEAVRFWLNKCRP